MDTVTKANDAATDDAGAKADDAGAKATKTVFLTCLATALEDFALVLHQWGARQPWTAARRIAASLDHAAQIVRTELMLDLVDMDLPSGKG
jgi:hypothetical protein